MFEYTSENLELGSPTLLNVEWRLWRAPAWQLEGQAEALKNVVVQRSWRRARKLVNVFIAVFPSTSSTILNCSM